MTQDKKATDRSPSAEPGKLPTKPVRTKRFLLRLYVAGMTNQSTLAIRNISQICEEHLKGRYDLEVIDIFQRPQLAKDEQIVAVPALVKRLPLPLRRVIGQLDDAERVLFGLDLRELPE